jgi:hypothetical protein
MAKTQSDVILDKNRNAYIAYRQSLKHKHLGEIDQLEDITNIDLFDLPKEEVHVKDIHLSGTDESLDHGHTHTMSGMGESLAHGCTEDACRTNSAMAGANRDLSLPSHTNGHED